MPSPVVWKTELALGSPPDNALSAQTWTDVSAFVREDLGASLSRGRSDENSEVAPSTFSLTFDNTDGRFTPGNAGSPYVNTLDIGTMIRRTAIIDAISFVRFTGYVDEISIPEWANSPFEKLATVSASDRLARLAGQRAGTMLAQVDYETLSAAPALYWPIGEEDGSAFASALSVTETDPLLVATVGAGDVEFGGGPALATDARTSAKFEAPVSETGFLNGPNTFLRAIPRIPIGYGGAVRFSMSAWAQPETIFGGNIEPTVVKVSGTGFEASIYIESTTGQWMGKMGTALVTGPKAGVGGLSFVALACAPSSPLKLWVNGVEYAGTTCPATTFSGTSVTVGEPFSGSIASVAVYRSALTATPVTNIYNAGATGTRGMLSHDAMIKLAGYAGVLAADITSTPRGTTVVDNVPTYGRSRTEVLQEVAKIEGGILFVDTSGALQFQTRAYRWGVPAPAYTFPRDDIRDTFAVTYNDAFIVNESTVRRTGGVTARASDDASKTKRGIYAEDLELRFGSDNDPVSRARYRVATYKDPKPRLGTFPVHVTTSLAQQSLMNINLGTLVALTGLSTDAPALGSQWIEGISESQSVDDYTITFATSPVMPTSSLNYFRVGSGPFSRVGTYAPIAP